MDNVFKDVKCLILIMLCGLMSVNASMTVKPEETAEDMSDLFADLSINLDYLYKNPKTLDRVIKSHPRYNKFNPSQIKEKKIELLHTIKFTKIYYNFLSRKLKDLAQNIINLPRFADILPFINYNFRLMERKLVTHYYSTLAYAQPEVFAKNIEYMQILDFLRDSNHFSKLLWKYESEDYNVIIIKGFPRLLLSEFLKELLDSNDRTNLFPNQYFLKLVMLNPLLDNLPNFHHFVKLIAFLIMDMKLKDEILTIDAFKPKLKAAFENTYGEEGLELYDKIISQLQ
jgi:hypothetical protein